MGTRQCAAPRAARGCGCGVSEAICREADPSPADPTPITSNYDHSALTPTTAITAALLSADAVGYDAPALRMKYTKAQAQHLEVRCACDRRSKRQQMGDAKGASRVHYLLRINRGVTHACVLTGSGAPTARHVPLFQNAFISSGKTRTPSARVRQEAADATGLRFETAIQVLHGNAYTLN